MVFRRRRLLLAGVAVFLLALTYHLSATGLDVLPDPNSRWIKAIKGDQDAFRLDLEESLFKFVPPAGGEIYPVQNLFEIPPIPHESPLPRIQHDFDNTQSAGAQLERQKAVKEAFMHSLNGYKQFAWGKDELKPVSGSHRASFGDWAATLVDSLDTLWLMGLKDEFEEGVEAVSTINFNRPDALPINVFETTIRYMGGFLGAYDITNGTYPVLLNKALEVGNMLYGAFDTSNRMPVTYWNKIYGEKASSETSIAEMGSLSLEFTRLSQLTGDMKFYDAIHRITECMISQQSHSQVAGLFPHTINAQKCHFKDSHTFSLGAFADSAFEYLPKMHQLLRGSIPHYKDMYLKTLEPIKTHLLLRPMTPQNHDILFPAIHRAYTPHSTTTPQMQHLTCFAGGMFALGSRLFSRPDDISTATRLTNGCIWAYNATLPTRIMPETFYFTPCPSTSTSSTCTWNETHYNLHKTEHRLYHISHSLSRIHHTSSNPPITPLTPTTDDPDSLPLGMTALSSPSYRLRPEAIESLFLLYRITGSPHYRDAAWHMFQSITAATRTAHGFSSIDDVTLPNPPEGLSEEGRTRQEEEKGKKLYNRKTDRQETFWTGETLKYLWLIFGGEEVLGLDGWVFSTEAHAFRVGGA